MTTKLSVSAAGDIYMRSSAWIQQRGKNSWIVTAHHVLKPPFTISDYVLQAIEDEGFDVVQFMVTGASGDRLLIHGNALIISKFRQQMTVATFDNDGVLTASMTLAPLPRSKQLILENCPPNSRLTSEELYQRIVRPDGESQRHARRRWKELKYDFGFEVDYDSALGIYWRGDSDGPINDPMVRPDDSLIRKEYWDVLAERSKAENPDESPHCNYCGTRVNLRDNRPTSALKMNHQDDSDSGLIDHRRPVFQGGGDELGNLQIFCQTCNNRKNSVCRNCPFGHKCDGCGWAHPEQFLSKRVVIYLSEELSRKLRAMYGANFEAEIPVIVAKFLGFDV